MERLKKTAKAALGKAVKVMRARLEGELKLNEGAEEAGTVQFIKNDELIKMANFLLSLSQSEGDGKKDDKTNSGGEVRFVLDDEVKKWAK